MNRWLAEESKWAREQALKAERRAENLSDPEWVRRRVAKIEGNRMALQEAVARWLDLTDERTTLLDDEERQREVDRAVRNAEHWNQLAAEQSARLAATEDTDGLFEETP